jgi:hypothetical protein
VEPLPAGAAHWIWLTCWRQERQGKLKLILLLSKNEQGITYGMIRYVLASKRRKFDQEIVGGWSEYW